MSTNSYLIKFYEINTWQVMIFRLYTIYNKYQMIKINYQIRDKSQVLSQVLQRFCCRLYLFTKSVTVKGYFLSFVHTFKFLLKWILWKWPITYITEDKKVMHILLVSTFFFNNRCNRIFFEKLFSASLKM